MSGFNSDPGSSKSSTSNTQTSTNVDGRIVGGDQSSNLSLNNNKGPVSVTLTDAGAVHDSLQLAIAGVESEANVATAALSSGKSMLSDALASNNAALSGALNTVGSAQSQFTSAIEQIRTGDKTTRNVVIGFAVVGVAVAWAIAQRKG